MVQHPASDHAMRASTLGRRALLALAAALVAAGARAEVRTIPAKRVWPYLETFARIPPQDRTRFQATYYVTTTLGAPATLTLIADGRRTTIPRGRDGRLLHSASAQELAAGQVEIDCPEKVHIFMQLEPTARPAAEMDASELAAAVAQAASAVKKLAPGPLQLVAPKLKWVQFKGVLAGEVVFADSHRAALPLTEGQPVFEPSKFPGAKGLRFPSAPSSIAIGD